MIDRPVSQLGCLDTKYGNVETFTTSSLFLHEKGTRLEGAFYGSDGYRALQAMEQSQLEIESIGTRARVIWLGPFGRNYVSSPDFGIPFLSSSEMMEANVEAAHYISTELSMNLEKVLVESGSILISRSGTVGNVAICTKDFDGCAVSEHAIRVTANDSQYTGLIYCFCQSSLGQFLLTRSKSGSVVETIYEADVANLPIPILPKNLRHELSNRISQACQNRVAANQLLRDAESLMYRQSCIDPDSVSSNDDELDTSVIRSEELFTMYERQKRVRLNGSFQEQRARRSEQLVRKTNKWKRLREVVSSIPFTGPGSVPGVNKVDREFGTPFVTARDLGLTRARPAAFVASGKSSLIETMKPKTGTTFIMCATAGVLGKVFYVCDNFETWAVSLDVIRVIPNSDVLHGGYVYSFLNSSLGRSQVVRHKYGSAIPRIHSRQVAEVCIPVPTDEGRSVGELVDKAFRLRQLARETEDLAIQLLELAIQRGRKLTEAEWGSEY